MTASLWDLNTYSVSRHCWNRHSGPKDGSFLRSTGDERYRRAMRRIVSVSAPSDCWPRLALGGAILLYPAAALAYLDPVTGSFIFQAIVGIVTAIAYVGRRKVVGLIRWWRGRRQPKSAVEEASSGSPRLSEP